MALGAYSYTIETRKSNVSQTQERRQRVHIVTGAMVAEPGW
jgi:hypothetical protein